MLEGVISEPMAKGKVLSMDDFREKQIRQMGFSLCAAIVGRYLLLYKTMYGSIPAQAEITDFCLKVIEKYDGTFLDINSPQCEELIIRCMKLSREFMHGKEMIA